MHGPEMLALSACSGLRTAGERYADWSPFWTTWCQQACCWPADVQPTVRLTEEGTPGRGRTLTFSATLTIATGASRTSGGSPSPRTTPPSSMNRQGSMPCAAMYGGAPLDWQEGCAVLPSEAGLGGPILLAPSGCWPLTLLRARRQPPRHAQTPGRLCVLAGTCMCMCMCTQETHLLCVTVDQSLQGWSLTARGCCAQAMYGGLGPLVSSRAVTGRLTGPGEGVCICACSSLPQQSSMCRLLSVTEVLRGWVSRCCGPGCMDGKCSPSCYHC